MAQEFTFTVNGVERTTTQNKPLLRYLRDDLHIHSAKDGCSEGRVRYLHHPRGRCGRQGVRADHRACRRP